MFGTPNFNLTYERETPFLISLLVHFHSGKGTSGSTRTTCFHHGGYITHNCAKQRKTMHPIIYKSLKDIIKTNCSIVLNVAQFLGAISKSNKGAESQAESLTHPEATDLGIFFSLFF